MRRSTNVIILASAAVCSSCSSASYAVIYRMDVKQDPAARTISQIFDDESSWASSVHSGQVPPPCKYSSKFSLVIDGESVDGVIDGWSGFSIDAWHDGYGKRDPNNYKYGRGFVLRGEVLRGFFKDLQERRFVLMYGYVKGIVDKGIKGEELVSSAIIVSNVPFDLSNRPDSEDPIGDIVRANADSIRPTTIQAEFYPRNPAP